MRPPSLALLLLLLLVTPHLTSGRLLSAVVRSSVRPDVLYPSTCPASCSQLFRAVENSSLFPCGCECPPEAPVYLHTAGECVEKLDECQTNVRFSSDNGSFEFLPITVLPARNGVLIPKKRILWDDAGVFESPSGAVDCSVNAVFFENAEHRWKASSRKLFVLLPSHNKSSIVFRGTEAEASQLAGAVVQLKLVCSGHPDDSLCLSFRVDGTSGELPRNTRNVRWELILACVCCALVLALMATLYIGFWCWRLEKKRLIGRIQMQILSDFRRQQQAHTAQFSRAEQGLSADFVPALLPKRRLMFHAEFLERECLENPPPMAEQFLAELRRMVDAARERIRLRRFTPMLLTIPELPEEHLSPISSRQTSPRSTRSVDSGRESREDSEGSEESVSPKASRSSRLPVVPSLAPLPRQPPPPSRIPAPIGSASPRTAQRNLTVPNKSLRARKGYAVFPVDPMLNKSLPRRQKRTAIPGPIQRPIS